MKQTPKSCRCSQCRGSSSEKKRMHNSAKEGKLRIRTKAALHQAASGSAKDLESLDDFVIDPAPKGGYRS